MLSKAVKHENETLYLTFSFCPDVTLSFDARCSPHVSNRDFWCRLGFSLGGEYSGGDQDWAVRFQCTGMNLLVCDAMLIFIRVLCFTNWCNISLTLSMLYNRNLHLHTKHLIINTNWDYLSSLIGSYVIIAVMFCAGIWFWGSLLTPKNLTGGLSPFQHLPPALVKVWVATLGPWSGHTDAELWNYIKPPA